MSKVSLILMTAFSAILAILILRGNSADGLAVFSRYLKYQIYGAIGVNVGVEPNYFNTAANQLKEKEATLNELEKSLEQKKADSDKTNAYLVAVEVILLILILLNFYFDHRKKMQSAN